MCAEASGALLLLADRIHADYTRAKKIEAVLDYDDLILKAARTCCRAPAPRPGCCSRSTAASTTSSSTRRRTPTPSNGRSSSGWRRSSSPASAQARALRTLFAVGDEKQSIYSFQGADPVRFGAVGRAFRAKALAAELAWHEVPLNALVPLDRARALRRSTPCLPAPPARMASASTAPAIIAALRLPQGRGRALVELWQPETEAKPDASPPFEPWDEGGGTDARGRGAVPAHRQADHVLARRWRGAGLGRAAGAPRRHSRSWSAAAIRSPRR